MHVSMWARCCACGRRGWCRVHRWFVHIRERSNSRGHRGDQWGGEQWGGDERFGYTWLFDRYWADSPGVSAAA